MEITRRFSDPFNHVLPGDGDLVLHFVGAESFIDRVHDLVPLVSASSAIETGHDDVLRAGQIRRPVDPETKV